MEARTGHCPNTRFGREEGGGGGGDEKELNGKVKVNVSWLPSQKQ
jgi:hypothetical protein